MRDTATNICFAANATYCVALAAHIYKSWFGF
jgi:hypothetical protein